MSQKKNLPPRHKRMKRKPRLQAAKIWAAQYSGKNFVKGYSHHFAVDKLCAVKELQMIGVSIDPHYVEQLKRSLEAAAKTKVERKHERQKEDNGDQDMEGDEDFEFIVGYTSWGFPYGIKKGEC